MHIFLMQQRLNNLGYTHRAHAPVGNYKATVLGLQASMQAHAYIIINSRVSGAQSLLVRWLNDHWMTEDIGSCRQNKATEHDTMFSSMQCT